MCKRIEACRFLSAGMKRLRTKKEGYFPGFPPSTLSKMWNFEGLLFFHFLLCIHTLFISPDWCNAKHGVMDLWRQLTRICWCWGFRLRDKVELKDFYETWEERRIQLWVQILRLVAWKIELSVYKRHFSRNFIELFSSLALYYPLCP